MPDEVESFEVYQQRAEAMWEEERQNEIDAVARRLEGADRGRVQRREHERTSAEQRRQQFANECAEAKQAWLSLYPRELAEKLDPAKSYTLIRLENLPALTGYLAFSSEEAAAACREQLRGSVLYADPEGGHRAVPGITIGRIVTRESLLGVDPSATDLAALASQVEASKAERHRAESAVLAREREDAEAEHLRKKYGAPVG